MKILNINSSALSAARYDEETMELEVQFHRNPQWYTSYNVPPEIVFEFENASSQGNYYQENIRYIYR